MTELVPFAGNSSYGDLCSHNISCSRSRGLGNDLPAISWIYADRQVIGDLREDGSDLVVAVHHDRDSVATVNHIATPVNKVITGRWHRFDSDSFVRAVDEGTGVIGDELGINLYTPGADRANIDRQPKLTLWSASLDWSRCEQGDHRQWQCHSNH